jgi:hypothetical protein
MHTVEFISATEYNLYDQWSKGDYAPYADTDLNTTDDLKNIQYSVDSSGYATIKYTRAYNTGDKYDYVVTPGKSMTISLAWNPGVMNDHKKNFKISSLTIDSSKLVVGTENTTTSTTTDSGSSSSVSSNTNNTPVTPISTPDDSEEFDFWEFHGIIMTVTWSIMNFVGYMSARFFRHYPIWIWVHFIFAGLNTLLSVGILGASIALSKQIINKYFNNSFHLSL